ncbi:MAG TPA: hypothetical protein VM345_02065 [Acidimicrobiales bacterium]|jgi:hypothetical protein|nr:hypothetical protein [Acidimicrobiales bacterium]
MRSRARAPFVCALLALSLLAACGDGDGGPEAQPSEDAPVFVEGNFGRIPVHPLAESIGARSTTGDVTAQSFAARGLSREQLFDWYDEQLDGWTQEVQPAPVGEADDAAWRGTWTNRDRRLIVTVSEGSTLPDTGSANEPRIQYSLSLEPIDRPLPGATPEG